MAVELEYKEGKVTLVVRDDGAGFDIEKIYSASHFGLTGIQERAKLIGGELSITSKPGIGTVIRLVYSQEAQP